MVFLQNCLHGLLKANTGRFLASRLPILSSNINENTENDIFCIQKRYAARKGKRIAATREKQRLARIRREEMKNAPPKVWKPKKYLVDKRLNAVSKKFNDENRKELSEIVDNVYILEHYKERKLSIPEALAFLRETHQEGIYDEPNALVQAKVELDLRTKKKTKFVENFRSIISFSNAFEHGTKRKVVAICKSDDDQEAAKNAGAEIVGSTDIIQMLKAGELSMENFDDLVCHGDMLIELAAIKKEINYYFPTKQRGNIGFDMARLVTHFVNGFEYKLIKDDIEPDYGYVQLPFGRLGQNDQALEENIETVLSSIDQHKPPGAPGDFISRVLILSEPSPEKFPISFWNYIDGYSDPNDLSEEDEEEKGAAPKKNSAKN